MDIVKTDVDLMQEFIIDLVEAVEVFNHSKKTFAFCEYLGHHKEYLINTCLK